MPCLVLILVILFITHKVCTRQKRQQNWILDEKVFICLMRKISDWEWRFINNEYLCPIFIIRGKSRQNKFWAHQKTFSKWIESIIGSELSLNGILFQGEIPLNFRTSLICSCAHAKIFPSLFVTVLLFKKREMYQEQTVLF